MDSPRSSRFRFCGALATLVVVWLGVHAAFTAHAWSEGYRGPFMPVWHGLAALAFVLVARRTFEGARWAAVWGPAFVATFAVGTLLWSLVGPWWVWLGVSLEVAYVVGTWASLAAFPRPPAATRRRSAQLGIVALLVVAGAEVNGHLERPGSERGRELVVAEFDRAYHEAGARNVRVERHGRELRIVSPTDPDPGIKRFAEELRHELAQKGPNVKAWQVGFDEVTVTNGHVVVHLPAAEFVTVASDPLERFFGPR